MELPSSNNYDAYFSSTTSALVPGAWDRIQFALQPVEHRAGFPRRLTHFEIASSQTDGSFSQVMKITMSPFVLIYRGVRDLNVDLTRQGRNGPLLHVEERYRG